MTVVHTIGHSTRSIEQFIALLRGAGIRALIDVRAFPMSRRYPYFNGAPLASTLAENSIAYSHAPALGGRRRPRPDSMNTGWRNEGFRGYADHMSSPEFRAALDALIASAAERPTTVMCAEAVPWRCHRALISDALVARGCEVRHVLDTTINPHALTDFARVINGEVSYPARNVSPMPQTELFGSG